MKNRVTVTIAGQEYALIAEESPEYTRKVADFVDEQVRKVLEETRVSRTDAAVLAGLNIADRHFKELEAEENLRRQLKESLEESAKLKMELSEAKRENFKLQTQLQNRKN